MRIISHNDLDGIGCALLISVIHDKPSVQFATYDVGQYSLYNVLTKQLQDPQPYLIISDLVLRNEHVPILNELTKHGTKILFIDHHISSKIINDRNIRTIIDTSISATKIIYNLFSSEFNCIIKYRYLVELIDIFDMFRTDNKLYKEALDLQRAFYTSIWYIETYKYMPLQERLLAFMKTLQYEPITETHKTPSWLKQLLQLYKNIKFNEEVESFYNDKLKLVKATRNYPIFDNIYRYFVKENYDGVLVYLIENNQTNYTVMLRTSLDSINLADIAAKWGGGGHKKASGCRISNKQDIYNIISDIGHVLNNQT